MHQTFVSSQSLVVISREELADLIETHSRAAVRAELAGFQPQNQHPELPELLTRQETAKLLRISLVSIHDWSKQTDDRPALLTPIKIGTRTRFRREEVLALVNQSPKYRRR